MKFTAGYLLGATTIVGLGAAFISGFAVSEWAHSKKSEDANKILYATVASMAGEYFKTKKDVK